MVSLAKDMVISSETDFFLTDPVDRKIEAFLGWDSEASSATLRTPLAATCFARASVLDGGP